MSTAPIDPPACPIAEVTSPRMPASLSKRIRRVRLNDALGVTGIDPAPIKKSPAPAGACESYFRRFDAAPPVPPCGGESRSYDSSMPPDRELFLIDGNSLAYRAYYALPDSIATS